MVYNPLFR
jgi:hypothetical protein